MKKQLFCLMVPLFTALLATAACSDDGTDQKKTANSPCKTNDECQTKLCYKATCTQANGQGNGGKCFGKGECRSFNCANGACVAGSTKAGEDCRANEECKSSYCLIGKCAAESKPDQGVDAQDAAPDWFTEPDKGPDQRPPDLPLPDGPAKDGGCTKDGDCDDYIDCTTDKCTSGKCSYTLTAGYCLISGACYATGKVNAKNKCQKCDTAKSTTAWSGNLTGTCSDTNLCTYDDKCQADGTCKGTAYKCDDGLWCTQDACTGLGPGPKGCTTAPFTNVCLIGVTCYVDKAVSTANTCHKCDVQYPFAWTAVVGKGCVTTFAGTGSSGLSDGDATDATFNGPTGLAIDSSGILYIADTGNSAIRILTQKTVSGKKTVKVDTLVGSAGSGFKDGAAATVAMMSSPTDLAVDKKGFVYVADTGNNMVRVVNSGLVTTLAGNTAPGCVDAQDLSAKFNSPNGIAVDSAGSTVWVADTGNKLIRKVVVAGGMVSTISGSGSCSATTPLLKAPYDIEYDGTDLYFTDSGTKKLYKLTSGITLSALNDPPTTAPYKSLLGLEVGATQILMADGTDNRLRSYKSGVVGVFAGAGKSGKKDDIALKAWLSGPADMISDSTGKIYISDTANNVIRLYTP